MRPLLAGLIAALLLPATASAVTPTYTPLPDNRPPGEAITTSPDGAVWFGMGTLTSGEDPPIGRIDPVTGAVATYPTPVVPGEACCANIIRDLAFDATNGRLWYTRSNFVIGHGLIASMTPGTTTGQAAALTAGTNVTPWGIAVASTGRAWFTEYSANNTGPAYEGNRVSSVTPDFGYQRGPDFWHQDPSTPDSSRYDAKPKGITIADDGTPWFVEESPGFPGYRIGKVGSATGGAYTEYLLAPCEATGPCSGSNTGTGPTSVAPGANGDIWFTNVIKNTVGKINPTTQQITQYKLTDIDANLAGGQPRTIRRAADGSLWVAQYGGYSAPAANAIVRIVPTDPPTADVYPVGADVFPFSVAPDTKGNVWFTATPKAGGGGAIGKLAGVVGASPTPDPTATPNPNPNPSATPNPNPQPTPTPKPGGTTVKPSTTARAEVSKPSGDKVKVNQICVGPPADKCSLVYLLDSREYVTGFPGTKANVAARKKRKPKWTVLARRTATLKGGQTRKVTVKLNGKGKKLRRKQGFKARLRVIQKLDGGKQKVVVTKTLKFKRK